MSAPPVNPSLEPARSSLYFDAPVTWRVIDGLAPYEHTVSEMEACALGIASGDTPEQVWLLEHPPLYTAGTSAHIEDLVDPDRFPVYDAGRGGQYTYHGPGQRTVYLMMDLKKRGRDVRAYVHSLEEWVIRTLAVLGIAGERRDGRVGIWVVRDGGREEKIAAIGVRIRRWVTFHGIAINVNPDLGHFGGIIPCGISDHGVTSLADLGVDISMVELDRLLKQTFVDVFPGFVNDREPEKSCHE